MTPIAGVKERVETLAERELKRLWKEYTPYVRIYFDEMVRGLYDGIYRHDPEKILKGREFVRFLRMSRDAGTFSPLLCQQISTDMRAISTFFYSINPPSENNYSDEELEFLTEFVGLESDFR